MPNSHPHASEPSDRTAQQDRNDDSLAFADGMADTSGGGDTDTDTIISRGGQMIANHGNDLGKAASGQLRDVDIDAARQQVRDCQSALVGLGYHLGDEEEPVDGINGLVDAATVLALQQFQDDNDLDMTGKLDRDTYETLMRAFEQAMSMRSQGEEVDSFMSGHNSTQEMADLEAIDDSEQSILELSEAFDGLEDAADLEDL